MTINGFCKALSNAISLDVAIVICLVTQIVWITIGQFTRDDPYPFIFMLTVSNCVQLTMMFVIANAQRDHHSEIVTAHKALHKKLDAHIKKNGPKQARSSTTTARR